MIARLIVPILGVLWIGTNSYADNTPATLAGIHVKSSSDGSLQPSLVWAPDSTARHEPMPLLVWLHSWSFDYRQKDAQAYLEQAHKRGWVLLLPNFRGKNNNPQAGGSEFARSD